jgi:MSHA biogenesis protein MshL
MLSSVLMLTSCVMPPRQGTAIDKIHNTLKQGQATDQAIAARGSRNTAMNTALLQASALNLPSAPGADKRFDVSVNNAPAKSFFMGLVAGTPYNIVVSPDVVGNISLKLKNVTVEEALQAVQDIYGYDYERTAYGFEVLPPSLQTQVFTINYLDAHRKNETNVTVGSTLATGLGAGTSTGQPGSSANTNSGNTGDASSGEDSITRLNTVSETNFWSDLRSTLLSMVGTENGRLVTVNPQSGIVIVRAYPNELRQIAQYLDKSQLSLNRQVIIEAKVLEVTLNDNFQAGINWNYMGAQLGGFPVTPLSQLTAPGVPGTSGFALNTTVGGFNPVINLLEQQGNVQTLANPRISTVNNQPAVIKVGTDRFFVTSVTTNVVPSGSGTSNSSSVGLTPFFSGITLDVTPEISSNGDIVLHMHPTVSDVVDDERVVNLGSTQGTLTLPTAESTIRESDSIVRAKNNQIVIIGGLMQHTTSENVSSTPGLGRIPFFGALFRGTDQASRKTELVILLKPTYVNDSTWADQLRDSRNQFCASDRGFHVGSRPEIFGTEGELNG